MDYDSTILRLREMESRYHSGFSSLDRSFLDSMYYMIFGKEITNKGCSNCYRDAYIEIYSKLKREQKMPKKSSYQLKAGAVITFFGSSQAFTNANLTDEVAVKYLSLCEENAKMFSYLPDGWETQVSDFQQNCTNDNVSDNSVSKIEMLEAQNIQLAAEKDSLQTELAGANQSLEQAYAERDALIEEVANLKAEIAKLSTPKATRSRKAKAATEDTNSEVQDSAASEPAIDLQ